MPLWPQTPKQRNWTGPSVQAGPEAKAGVGPADLPGGAISRLGWARRSPEAADGLTHGGPRWVVGAGRQALGLGGLGEEGGTLGIGGGASRGRRTGGRGQGLGQELAIGSGGGGTQAVGHRDGLGVGAGAEAAEGQAGAGQQGGGEEADHGDGQVGVNGSEGWSRGDQEMERGRRGLGSALWGPHIVGSILAQLVVAELVIARPSPFLHRHRCW